MDQNKGLNYELKDKTNGIYLFVLEGSITANNQTLNRRDAIGIWDIDSLQVQATADAQLLLMEIPMELPSYLQ